MNSLQKEVVWISVIPNAKYIHFSKDIIYNPKKIQLICSKIFLSIKHRLFPVQYQQSLC